jgi:hypothetical protein
LCLLYYKPIFILINFSVFAVKGREDVSIHVRDRGGGIPRRLMGSIFEYLYTTAVPVITSSTEIHVKTIAQPIFDILYYGARIRWTCYSY